MVGLLLFLIKIQQMFYVIAAAAILILTQSMIENRTQVVLNALANKVENPLRKIDDIFAKLPGLQKLDGIVLSGDSVVILKAIQTIASNSQIDCEFKIAYLLQLYGRMRSTIYKKTLMSKQLQIIIQNAEDTIKRLDLKIQTAESDKRSLFLDQKRLDLNLKLSELESLYKEFNKVTRQLEPKQKQIAQSKVEIRKKEDELQIIRQQILDLKISSVEIDSRFSFGSLPKFWEEQIYNNQNEITELEKLLLDKQLKLYDINRQFRRLQQDLENIKNKLDTLKKKSLSFEVDLSRIRDQISVGEQKTDQINKRIDEYQSELFEQYAKLLTQYKIQDLNQMTKALRNQLPGLIFEIDRQYYRCYSGTTVVDTRVNNSSGLQYTINGSAYSSYIFNSYDQRLNASQNLYILHPIDIFSQEWKNTYGIPFSQQQSTAQDPMSRLTIVTDFYCLNPSATNSGLGTIFQIKGRIVTILNSSFQKLRLVLGACTRVECSNCPGKVLDLGNKVFWRGIVNQQSPNYVQLYSATFH